MHPPDTRIKVRTFRVPMFVIAAALVTLIVLLATLQYRWLGQISNAERDRMTANLGTHSTGLAQEFDHELTRAYATFQLDAITPDDNLASRISVRYDNWLEKARYPRMVRDIYIARKDGEALTLQRYIPAARFVEPLEWPAALLPIRDSLVTAATHHVEAARGLPGTFVIALPQLAWEQVPALVIQLPVLVVNSVDTPARSEPHRFNFSGFNSQSSFVVVHLDRDYIANEMLPAMVAQQFRVTGDAYQVAVMSASGKDLIYTSDRAFSPSPNTKVDASADLFQVRMQEFGGLFSEIRRFVTSSQVPRESIQVHRLETSPRTSVITNPKSGSSKSTMSIMVQQSVNPTDRAAIIGGAAGALASSRQPSPRWRLVVQHPSGSLEAAVNSARRRNMLVSTSVMALLGVSVGFLIVTTRRAQELAQQQMEFVAAVSHELRTPLAVIRSAADNLAEGVIHDPPQVKKYGDLVRFEGRRLSEMVEQILELAGIQSGQRSFALRAVSIRPLLHDIVRSSSTLIEEARIEAELDLPETLPPVLGDESALRRVFQNLIGNAIKYGGEGRWMRVTARQTGREVAVTVADRGLGIPASEQARVFDAFYRAPNVVDAQIQGAGLGLSLVQRIVEAHGGRITLKSAEGSGSEFTVHLPAASEEPVARTSATPDPALSE